LKIEVIIKAFNYISAVLFQIAVIQNSLSEADLNLIPPGPDYLILLVKYNTDKHAR